MLQNWEQSRSGHVGRLDHHSFNTITRFSYTEDDDDERLCKNIHVAKWLGSGIEMLTPTR